MFVFALILLVVPCYSIDEWYLVILYVGGIWLVTTVLGDEGWIDLAFVLN